MIQFLIFFSLGLPVLAATADATLAISVESGGQSAPTLGETFSYHLAPANTGDVPLDNLVVIDSVPIQMRVDAVTTGSYSGLGDYLPSEGVRVSYEKNTAPGVFTLWGSSPNVTANTTLNAPPPGLGAGEHVTRIRWEYGQAQAGMVATTRPAVRGRIVNPDNAGGPVALGNTIDNNAALTSVYTVGSTLVNRTASFAFVLGGEAPGLVVTTASDSSTNTDNQTSLREALAYAATLTGPQTITFSNSTANGAENFHDGTARTITLGGTQLDIASHITITGPGADRLTISGDNRSRIFYNDIASLSASGLTLAYGNGNNQGGGAIFSTKDLTLTDCRLMLNRARNSGCAVHLSQGTLEVIRSTFSGNGGTGIGGAIFVSEATFQITDCVFSENVTSNSGGAIACSAGLSGTIRGATFSNNESLDGGALFIQDSDVRLLNSTFSGNRVINGSGGAIYALGLFGTSEISLVNCSFVGNSATTGGGIYLRNLSNPVTLSLANTILSGNSAPSLAQTPNTTFLSLGHNLCSDGGGGFLTHAADQINTDPRLSPLLDFGGPTPTHALLAGSPALDAGSDALAVDENSAALATDQRGKARQVGTVDIGAYEAPARLVVTNTADSGAGSLRDALDTANGTPADEMITFDIPRTDAGVVNGVATITLTSGQLTVNRETTAGQVVISNATGASRLQISGNNASRVCLVAGGARAVMDGLTLTRGNPGQSGGGVRNFGTVLIHRCLVFGNVSAGPGAGLANDSGTMTLFGTTVSGNHTTVISDGGGIANSRGTLNVINSTISGNSSTGTGGIANDRGTLHLTNVTVTANSATDGSPGGVSNVRGSVNVRNSIVAGNSATGPEVDLYTLDVPFSPPSTITSQGFNLFGGTTGATIDGDLTGNIVGQPSQLAPLGYYGGTTPTHALLPDSPAINNGTVIGAPLLDQRGAGRSGNVDIGAYELNANFPAPLPAGNTTDAYTQELVPDRGSYAYTVKGGSTLPPGLNLVTTGGSVAFAGTPTGAGTFTFILTATDGTSSFEIAYTVTITDTTPPAVTLTQAAGQADPVQIAQQPIHFTAIFSEPVTGFDTGDVTLSAPAGATATVTEIAPNDGTTYDVAVSGATALGQVTVSLASGIAQDAAGNDSLASTGADNTVTIAETPSLTVTTGSDTSTNSDNQTSLREALAYAQTLSGSQTITFDPSLAGQTVSLGIIGDNTFGPSALLVNTQVTIDGGTNKITISRDASTQPMRLRLFYVTSAGSLTLKNLTLSGGLARGGNAINSGGGGAGLGGAIVNAGTLQILQSTLLGHLASGGQGGSDTGFAGSGGGLGGDGAGLAGGGPEGGDFQRPGGFGGGGGIRGSGGFGGGSGANGSDTTGGFGGGGAGASQFGSPGGFGAGNGSSGSGAGAGGLGGAIFNFGGTVSLRNSTLSGNSAIGGTGANDGSGLGGAIFNLNGTVAVTSSTLANNIAAEGGGAIYSLGDNGIATQAGPVLRPTTSGAPALVLLHNSILSGSDDGAATPVPVSDFVQNAHDSGNGGGAGFAESAGSDSIIQTRATEAANDFSGSAITADPLVGPLRDNGGPTPTRALLSGSVAIDAGNSALALDENGEPLTIDQRGEARVVGAVDIGAFEARQVVPSLQLTKSTFATDDTSTVTAAPEGGVFAVRDAADGLVPGLVNGTTLSASVPGSYTLDYTYTSEDGIPVTTSLPFTVVTPLTLGQPNQIPAYWVTVNTPRTIDFPVSGGVGPFTVVSGLTSLPPGMRAFIDGGGVRLIFTPVGAPPTVGTFPTTVTIEDINGKLASANIDVTVSADNPISVITPPDTVLYYYPGPVQSPVMLRSSSGSFGNYTNRAPVSDDPGFGIVLESVETTPPLADARTLLFPSFQLLSDGISRDGVPLVRVAATTAQSSVLPPPGTYEAVLNLRYYGFTFQDRFTIVVLGPRALGAPTRTQWTANRPGFANAVPIINAPPDQQNQIIELTGLPNGVSATISNGQVIFTGTPTETGSFLVSLTVTNAFSGGANAATTTFTLVISEPPALGTLSPSSAEVDRPYTGFIPILNGTAPFSDLSVTGLPDGITAALSSDGLAVELSGTPTTRGTSAAIAIALSDAAGAPATGQFAITVTETPSLNVTTTSDTSTNIDGLTSLREAIDHAKTLGGAQTVRFNGDPAALPRATGAGVVDFYDGATHTLEARTTLIINNQSLTITGTNAERLILRNVANAGTLLSISGGSMVDLSGMTVTGAAASGINSRDSTLALRGCAVSRNAVDSDTVTGGGISNLGGNLTLVECTVSDNAVQGVNRFGGGIYNSRGTATLRNSTVSGNSLSGSSNNRGAGIYNEIDSTMILVNSTVSGNSSIGGNSHGAGIYSAGTLEMINCTVTNNSASGGADIVGGVANLGTGHVRNSIISGNTGGATPDLFGSLATDLNNLIGDQPSLRLASLAANGGPTMTHALLPGSSAIDAGDNSLAVDESSAALTNDQRGTGFARIVKGSRSTATATVDIGAFELFAAPRFTSDALSLSIAAAPLDLAMATGVSPAGGVFSGPGVSGGFFDPRNQAPGVYTLTYTVTDAFGVSNFADFTVTVGDLPPSLTVTGPQRFKTTSIGSRSRPGRITIRNVGGLPTGTLRVSVSGPGKKDFIVTQPGARELAAGELTVCEAVFRPRKTGNRRASVTVYSDAPPVSVTVQGRGRADAVLRPPRAVRW